MSCCEALVYTGSEYGYGRCGRHPAELTSFERKGMPLLLCSSHRFEYEANKKEQETTQLCPCCKGKGRVPNPKPAPVPSSPRQVRRTRERQRHVMGCEHTKKQRVRFLAADPTKATTLEERRLTSPGSPLLKDRVVDMPPMWICGPGMGKVVECQVDQCSKEAALECDGCDIAICEAHATNRGQQTIEVGTGFTSPGWDTMAYLDSYDLCPFCLFKGGTKDGTPGLKPKRRA